MYVHLESGACDSTIGFRDVFRAFAAHHAAELLLVDNRKGVLQCMFDGTDPDAYPFKCPGKECGELFKFFSGFLQHTEAGNCSFKFNKSGDGSMLTHMEKHLFLDVATARISKMAGMTKAGIQIVALVPEHPKERAGAAVPDVVGLRPYFTSISRCIQNCLKELQYRVSTTVEKPGMLRVRIPKAFARDLEALERTYFKALNKYSEEVTEAPRPHGDVLIYFQATKCSLLAWKFLNQVYKLIRVFRVALDCDVPPLH
ncbi:hypothetical protein AA313_de0203956 [Arthrobotrys entomopaga]|nr:hypothetical protein AA313_de0203956 [Arthrobotrys entomopaga]